jgi:HEAT repeat protein
MTRTASLLVLTAVLVGCEPNLPSDLAGLMNAMGDYDMRVSIAAAKRVEKLYGKAGLLQALQHPNSYTRSKAAHFLMDFSGPDVEAALSKAAADPDAHVRMWCAWSLGEQGTATVLPLLEALAQDREEIVCLKAAEAVEKVRQRGAAS